MDYGFHIRRFRFVVLWAALVAVMPLLAADRAIALDECGYQLDFNVKYEAFGTTLDDCRLCHFGAPVTFTTLNSFGSHFADVSIGNHTFNDILENTDSDADGFTNIQEIRAETFPGDFDSRPPVVALTGLSITGPGSVNEGEAASYTAVASWSDGSETTVSASWTVAPTTFATMTADGMLTSSMVDGDQTVTVSAAYEGASATAAVTIVNLPDVSLMPANGADNVYIGTVVTVSTDGSEDIRSVVDPGTFTLASTDPVAVSSVAEAGTCAGGAAVPVAEPAYNATFTEVSFTLLCTLASETTYSASIQRVPAGNPPVPGETISWTFTTSPWCPDSDGDGVDDCHDVPPDDNCKATPPSAKGTGKFLVDAYGNAGNGLMQCFALWQVEGIPDTFPQLNRKGKPFGADFPDGVVRYAVKGVAPGATVTVAVSFPSGVPPGSRVFKVDEDGFHPYLGAVVVGDRVVVTLTDGGDGDADGVADGVIVDPIG
ncbi:MAG TPA: choice-of-anchor U domain-containing protein, partial [Candidatus Aquicultoraceae bacterium]|nr:choice-of-anchor U domain-containing protein [Candidatus Aquicultoraceae bacterium]